MASYLIQHYLDCINKESPNHTALTFPNEIYSYKDVWTTSNQISHLLLQNGFQRNERVALFLSRSPKNIMALLGILKADGIYVVVDGKAPAMRLQLVANDCTPRCIICDKTTIQKVTQILPFLDFQPSILLLEDKKEVSLDIENAVFYQNDIHQQAEDSPDYKNIDTDIAHIIYTSGSTGMPKGVMISHLNITNYINWAVKEFEISNKDVILGTAPFHFDMSTFDIFSSLKSGCTFCISPDTYLLFPKKLLNYIDKQQITIWKGISSLLMYLARTRSLENNDILTLKKIIFAGEVLPTKYLIEWMKRYPDKEFYNGYGPSEGTGMSTFYKVKDIPKDPLQQVPIGKACSNSEIILLNEDLSETPVGEIGEICIRGSGVSSGYWNDPEKTKNVFITNPLTRRDSDRIYRTGDLGFCDPEGNITFAGRKDQQVKWMGYRIELGEIENTLISYEEIKDVVVFLYESTVSNAEKELIACVEIRDNVDLTQTLEKLSNQLPPYMVPKRLVPVVEIPRSDRGKVDRKKVLEQFSALAHRNKVNRIEE